MKKIYVFINGGKGTEWAEGAAISEDGVLLAQHVSSNERFFRYDMGLKSDRKHDRYKSHYPNGYELIEVEDIKNHPGLNEAIRLNQERGKK